MLMETPQVPGAALITTVHDPEGRLLPGLHAARDYFSAYESVYAFATVTTDSQAIEALRVLGVHVETGPTGVPGVGQRTVLSAAVQNGHGDVFYCDLDRWLHWTQSFPQELLKLPELMRRNHADAWYVCLGRTRRAFATHPLAQLLPEKVTNRALSVLAGKCLDATGGAAWIRARGANIVLAESTSETKATDLEWPGLILRHSPSRLHGAFLEGLEFETADIYMDEIERIGSVEAWIRATYDRPQVLRDRLQLASDSITALMRVTAES